MEVEMLVLTRRPTEAIMIGEDVRIFLLSIHGQQVRFGINAPSQIKILREELYLAEKNRTRQVTEPLLQKSFSSQDHNHFVNA